MPFNTYKQPINTICADLLLWEDYTEWQARKSAALSTGQLTALDRRCGYDNDRWQMAIIEGTSLGSTALALAGAPLRISVTHPNGEVFVIDPQGACYYIFQSIFSLCSV